MQEIQELVLAPSVIFLNLRHDPEKRGPVHFLHTCQLHTECQAPAEKAAAFGLKVQYHNHAKEYLDRWGEGYRMDRIMANTLPQVLFEPDLGWMEIGGCRCIPQLEKYAARIEIVHLKDYFRESFDTAKEHLFRPTGYGVMDWGELIPFCQERIRPRWYTADHDKAYDGDVFGELGMSLDFIRSILELC